MLLTDTRIKHLKAGAKEQSFSDGRGTQLYCRIKPNAVKTFIFRYCYHGRVSNITLGKYPATSLKTARAKAAEYKRCETWRAKRGRVDKVGEAERTAPRCAEGAGASPC